MVGPWARRLGMLAALCAAPSARGQVGPSASPQARAPAPVGRLRAVGRHFVDPAGRVVLLRGVNVAGNAKVPPFLPLADPAALDPLPKLGVNVVRLVFIWEAFEPSPGRYDEAYLARMRAIAAEAAAREMFVIVDVHQDGFSRFVSRGSGDGFPPWAVSPRATLTAPDNGPRCKNWPVLVATDPSMHRSFADFYADRTGVRTRYLLMLRRVAAAFADVPGVIGYDLLNEPWGDERSELAPLYRDAVAAIRPVHPSAILFLEGHISTNTGLQTRLPRPGFDNAAYAPHFYHPVAIVRKAWGGRTALIGRAFAHMRATADAWDAPLFLGEFGMPAEARGGAAYLDCLYDRLDACLASGAQWNYTPGWNERDKDGWNAEDFNILAPTGRPRPNLVLRPYPRATAGVPLRFLFRRAGPPGGSPSLEFLWDHRPERGDTEIFVPAALFPPDTALAVEGPGASFRRDEARQLLICRSPHPGPIRLRLAAPPAVHR